MKASGPIFILTLALAVASMADQPFERYRTIIDRKPFGPEPVNFDPEAAPGSAAAAAAAGGKTEEQRTAEEQQLAASVRVSMINVTPAGKVAVGFTDSSANPQENYYLVVGRSQNGWTVKSADPAEETVTLEKDGIEVTVKLGETAGGKKGAKPAAQQRPAAPRNARTAATAPSPQKEEANGEAPPRLGGLARLRMHRMQLKAQEEAKERREAAAAAEREAREAEREAARQEELEQQRETLRQLQEQVKRDREEREAAKRAEQARQSQEDQGEANNVE